jgi:tRNA G18 (ribose-2'-O)-methylase SpoU
VRLHPIDDPADPRLEDYRDLRDAELRRRRGLFAVEGRLMVERLLTISRFRTRSVLATPDSVDALRGPLGDVGIDAYVASHEVIRDIVGFKFHRGALALGERGESASLTLPASARTVVALENVRDPENVGGVLRNAHAFAVDAVVLDADGADPLGRKAIRVSAGAALVVPFARASSWRADLERLKEAGFTLIALTPDPAAPDIAEVAARGRERVALLLGSEEFGLSAATRAAADVAARIPMAPGVDSLNVAVAAGIALYRLNARAT